MNLRTGHGFVELIECPHCEYLVYRSNMIYEAGEPLRCRFCQAGIRAERELARSVEAVVIEWSMTVEDRVNIICEMMGDNYFSADSFSARNVLTLAVGADRRMATAKYLQELGR